MAATGIKLVATCHVYRAFLPQRLVEDFGTLTVLGSRHIAGECCYRSDVRKESLAGVSCSICFVAGNSFL